MRTRLGRALAVAAVLLTVTVSLSAAMANPVDAEPAPTTRDGEAGPTGTAQWSISAGYAHTCALTTAGTVDCWGSNSDGQSADQTGDTYTAIAAAYAHTCALTTAGTVDCWGKNDAGQATDQTATTHTAVATGLRHTCALTTVGTIDCWGSNSFAQSVDQTGTTYTAIAAGRHHNCAITTGGTIDCWGSNSLGQAADQTGHTYTAVTAGGAHSCAITSAGTIDCWGSNIDGQAADQTGHTYTAVTAGHAHTCAITTTGTIDCWGDNSDGQATDQTGTTYTTIAAGWYHTCAITTTGTVDCWGKNDAGQATDALSITSTAPASAELGTTYSHAFTHAPDLTVTWSVSQGTLPPGLALDPDTGVLSGTPTAVGSHTFDVTATSLLGTGTQTATIVVGSAPGITAVADQAIEMDTTTGPLSFEVSDAESLPDSLTTTATSDNQTLLPDADLVLSGIGATRTVTATPASGQTGSATVTVTVTDPDGLSASMSFTLTVVPVEASISGTVTTSGSTPVEGALVAALRPGSFTLVAFATTGPDGTYTISGLEPGDYHVAVLPLPASGLSWAWYDNAATLAIASAATDLVGVDNDLVAAGTLSGTVTDGTGPVPGATVRIYTPGSYYPAAQVVTGPDGTWSATGLAPGDYKIHITGPAGYNSEWHDDAPTATAAATHTLTSGATISGLDTALVEQPVDAELS